MELFAAEAGDKQVGVSQVEPQDADFTVTRVLRSTTGAATGPEPSVTQSVACEGAAEEFVDIVLENGTTYYYNNTAFTSDDADNWSARDVSGATPRDSTASKTTITPSGPPRLSDSASAAFRFRRLPVPPPSGSPQRRPGQPSSARWRRPLSRAALRT